MINAQTKICCLIGNPVAHSLSPPIHNAAYQKLGINYVYLAFRITDLAKAITGIREFGIKGISVTIPYKEKILKYLDDLDPLARKIGAVNTVVNHSGFLKGYNTDCWGAIKALKEKTKLYRKKVAILGAGGACRAIASGLKEEGAKIILINRSIEKAKKLAKEFLLDDYFPLERIDMIKKAEIIINATSVGTLSNESLINKEMLESKQIVFDIVYNPKETKLIKEAKASGCRVVYGYKMLLYQAVYQFKLFTGRKAPVELMEKTLLNSF